MEDDFLHIGTGENPKIPWTEAVKTPTASCTAPGRPFPSYSSSQPTTKRQKPPRKLAARLEGLAQRAVTNGITNNNSSGVGEMESPSYIDEMSEQNGLASIMSAAARYTDDTSKITNNFVLEYTEISGRRGVPTNGRLYYNLASAAAVCNIVE